VALLGLTEVAAREVLQVEPVLNGQWLVEPIVLAKGPHRGGVADGALAEVGRGGVTRDQLGEDKRDESDSEAEEDEGGEAPAEEP